jgi:hypothetical protein
MLQMGIIALAASGFADVGIHVSIASLDLAFGALLDMGLSLKWLGVLFFIFGGARLIALRLNGSWVLGPHIRIICALVGLSIWVQLLYGVVDIYYQTGDVLFTVAIWDTLLWGEYKSLTRAVVDIRRKPSPEE